MRRAHSVLELSGALDRQGRPLPPSLGVMSFVMDQVGGDWRIIAFQNNDRSTATYSVLIGNP